MHRIGGALGLRRDAVHAQATGLTSLRPLLELALALALSLHHAVRGDHVQVDADLAGLDEISTGGDHAY